MNRARRNTEQDGDQLSQAIICWNKAGLIDDIKHHEDGVIEKFSLTLKRFENHCRSTSVRN